MRPRLTSAFPTASAAVARYGGPQILLRQNRSVDYSGLPICSSIALGYQRSIAVVDWGCGLTQNVRKLSPVASRPRKTLSFSCSNRRCHHPQIVRTMPLRPLLIAAPTIGFSAGQILLVQRSRTYWRKLHNLLRKPRA